MDSSLLALSPEYFARSSRFVRREIGPSRNLKPYSMANRELEIELPLCLPRELGGYQLAILNCVSKDFPSKNISIYLMSKGDEENSEEENRKEENSSDEDSPYNPHEENNINDVRVMLDEGDFKRKMCHKLEFLEYKDVASSLQMIYAQRAVTRYWEPVD
jgi:hypothetical protein